MTRTPLATDESRHLTADLWRPVSRTPLGSRISRSARSTRQMLCRDRHGSRRWPLLSLHCVHRQAGLRTKAQCLSQSCPARWQPKKPRRKPSHAAQRARFDRRWQGTWATYADLQDGRFINKTGLGTYYGLSPTWIKRLEAWLRSKSKTVFLKPNRYSSTKAPPVRLYDRDLVETFINNHASELRRWQQRYQRNA